MPSEPIETSRRVISDPLRIAQAPGRRRAKARNGELASRLPSVLRSWIVTWCVAGALACACLVAACGGSTTSNTLLDAGSSGQDGAADVTLPNLTGDGGGGSGITALFFTPASATVTLHGSGTATASFTLHARYKDGSVAKVDAKSVEFDRPDLASLKAGEPVVLTAGGAYAGKGTLQAIYQGMSASATLLVEQHVVVTGPGLPPGAQAALNGKGLPADPAVSSLLYPYDKTYFPLGLTSPLVMWNAPNAADVYRIHFSEKHYVYDGYFVVPQPAQLRVPQADWDEITASNVGDPLEMTLYRWDAATMTAYTSATESFTIVPASMQGAIYYWTTTSGGHMSRIQPGTGATPQVLNGGACMGCHAVSADGSTLVAAVEGAGSTSSSPPGPNQAQDQGDGRPWVSFSLPAVTQVQQSAMFAGNVAVNPDGKYVVFGDQTLYLADTKTAMLYTGTGLDNFALDPGMSGLMTPAFAPDGKHFVAIEGAGSWYHNLMNGKLVLFDFDEATRTFSSPKALAAASLFPASQHAMAYPTFSPDASYVAFHVGDYDTGCDAQGCDANATQIGAIYLQATSGTAPVRLDTLTDSSPNPADHNLTFEPTFNPVERGGYFWVVVSSSRDWGNRITGTPNNGKKRLWVAAIDGKPGAADPSHPAFFLDGQEEDTENMRGFWALAQCVATPVKGGGGGACTAGFQCCSGFCDMGTCVNKGKLSCAGVGGACSAVSDCCNASSVSCTGGKCEPIAPK